MSEHLQWDFDNPAHRRRRPRVEVLPPEEPPRRYHVDVTVRRNRSMPWIVPVAIIVAVLVLWRLKLGLLMLAALVGRDAIEAVLFVVALLGVLAWRERRAGRPF
jgi:hypothetical protein